MSKDKKNKKVKGSKNKSLFKNVKSVVSKKPVLLSLLGAGVGLVVGASLGKERRRALADSVTNAFSGLTNTSGNTGDGSTASQENAG
ncbi:hypothetical protein [Sabulibacter ruber]|uniref:hypothetical protein n=1 Tax=Sabulibacter ruber TaxID=2811901 RepID=UPI001A96B95F|nr:hypothetical protein [Sabulibacter ruber]